MAKTRQGLALSPESSQESVAGSTRWLQRGGQRPREQVGGRSQPRGHARHDSRKTGRLWQRGDITAFLKIVDDHQKKLRSDCRTLANRLYSEEPKFWRSRLELCWTAWKEEH